MGIDGSVGVRALVAGDVWRVAYVCGCTSTFYGSETSVCTM